MNPDPPNEEPAVDPRVISELDRMKAALDQANAAPAVETTDPTTGKKVTSLKVRLSPAESQIVMAMPPEHRAAMAQAILADRARRRAAARVEAARVAAASKHKKRKRKLARAAKRKGR